MARFYVNRGGGRVPEGPFEEEQILKLIRAGKLSAGHVSALGSQRFFPLASHPPFAQALSEAGVPPQPGAAAPRTAGTPSAKSPSRGLLLGAVLAIFGLALAAVALGMYVMFGNGAMPARHAVPIDSELFLEVTRVPQLLADLRAVRGVDVSQLLGKQLLSDTAADLSASFGVSKTRADALIHTASSLGIAGRKLSGAAEGGVLLSFSNATPMNAFLSSKRFAYTGLVRSNGRKYRLSAAEPEAGAAVGATRRALSAWSLDSGAAILVWFETSKVLFVGSPSFAESVARVVSLDAPSIEQSPGFRDALRDFSDQPDAIGYVDATKLGAADLPPPSSLVGNYLKGLGPITASFRWVPAGLLAHFVARHAAKEQAKGAPTVPALPLTISDRLPAETFAYVAAVSDTRLSGAALEQLLLEQLAANDPETAQQVKAGIEQIEQRLQVPCDQVLGSIGDQTALAVIAPPDYSLALAQPQQMLANFAVVYLQALKDEGPLRELAKQLKTALGPVSNQFEIRETPDGYSLRPKDQAFDVSAQLHFTRGLLFLSLGGSALVERSWRAFSAGENTLASEPAQRAARAALPSTACVVAWIDSGRIVDTLQKNPLLAARMRSLDRNGLHWTGPDRLTTALAISSDVRDASIAYRVDTLNLPLIAGFGLP